MPEFSTRSIYINLKGNWTRSAFDLAQKAVDTFMEDIGHDDVGEPELGEDGQAYAYDAGYPSDAFLDTLTEALDAGPAWTIRIEEGDEVGVTTHVGGPDVESGTEVEGNIEDPSIRLSQIDDKELIANLQAAQAVEKMPFTLSDA